ncbi:MAG: ABC transporter ATP-binding protein/permease [Acidimicrobiia bacterium]|nr:ABC transporter ATP-binding protein/permease [Acidimicrobiia bacterium]NNC75596.1 ABC transporter ATP-binding protein [Acidimicrobiia bacterium]
MIPIKSYWRLLKTYLRPYRTRVVVLTVLLFSGIALQVVNPQIIRIFIDRATEGTELDALVGIAVIFILVAFTQQALAVVATYFAQQIGWSATNELRRDLADHLLHLDMGFHKSRTPGELVERIDGDVTALSNFFSQFVIHVVGNMALLAGVLFFLFRESVLIGVSLVVFSAATLAVMVKMQEIATEWWARVKAHKATFYGFLGEVVGSTEDIRGLGAGRFMVRRFAQITRAWMPDEVRGRWGWSILWATNIVVFAAGAAIVFGLGSWLYETDALTLGSVYVVFHYTEMLRHPLDRIRHQMEDMQKAAAGITRIQNLFGIESRLPHDGTAVLPSGPLSIDLDDVDFSYVDDSSDGDRVLHGLTLQLDAGKVIGVLGRTGSGKSTLARLLTRLYDPESGDVRLGGVSLADADIDHVRRRVGMVTQDVQLFRATIRDNLTFYDRTVSDERIWEALGALGLTDWIAAMPDGVNTMLESGGSSLSAGEAQLLAFTRIFLEDSGLVVLDEASSRLDPVTETLIERAVDRLLENRTGVIIAHRLDTLNRADEVLILDDGRIVEAGDRAALAADPGSRFHGLLAAGMEEVLG